MTLDMNYTFKYSKNINILTKTLQKHYININIKQFCLRKNLLVTKLWRLENRHLYSYIIIGKRIILNLS